MHAAKTVSSTIPDDLFFGVEYHPAIHYARTLLELGEYAHAAAVLSETSLINKAASVESMPPPLADLPRKAVYFRAYALYMAGERRKEEDILELRRFVTICYHFNAILRVAATIHHCKLFF